MLLLYQNWLKKTTYILLKPCDTLSQLQGCITAEG